MSNVSINSIDNVKNNKDVNYVTQVIAIDHSTGLPINSDPDGTNQAVYNDSLVANQVVEVNSLDYHAFGLDQYLVNQTNVTGPATAYYPSAAGFKSIPYRKFMLMDYCTGGVTNYVQISPDSTFGAPINLLVQNVNDGTTTAILADSNGKAFDILDLCPCYIRIKSDVADSVNTVKIALTGMSL